MFVWVGLWMWLMFPESIRFGGHTGQAFLEKDRSVMTDSNEIPMNKPKTGSGTEKVVKSDQEWRKILTPEQYHILRQRGTEAPYTGVYNEHFEKGRYKCAGCGLVLFASKTKYPSHCGWPAFYDVEKRNLVIRRTDRSYGMVRVEVLCSRCGGHLGHVFEDGPPPTGLRYCINSAALTFEPDSSE